MLGYLRFVYIVTKLIEGSRYGYYLFAVRDDEEAASAAGVNPLLARTGAMCLSAFLTAIGGSLFAQYFLFLDPTHVDLARAVVSVRAAAGAGRSRHGDRARARLVRDHAAVGIAALVFRRRRARACISRSTAACSIVVMLYFPSGIAGALQRADPGRKRHRDDTARGPQSDARRSAPLKAVDGVTFLGRRGRTRRPDRTERRRQEHTL